MKHTYEGIEIQPLYTRRDQVGDGDPLGLPGMPPFARGTQPLGAVLTGWDLRPEYAHPDLEVTNQAVLDDLAGGATSLLLRLDDAACRALIPIKMRRQSWPATTVPWHIVSMISTRCWQTSSWNW